MRYNILKLEGDAMYKYKLVIFDLDGTILDTIPDIHDALNYSLQINGLRKITLEEAKSFIGNGMHTLVKRAVSYLGFEIERNPELFDNVLKEYATRYAANCDVKTAPIKGIEEVLAFLRKEGVKLAVLTNKPHTDAVKVIDKYFPDIFDYVLGAMPDGKIKPDPTSTLKIIDIFGVQKEEVLFVGDSDVDIMTAKNSGVDVVGCSYGYRSFKQLQKAGAGYIINTPRGILNCFRKEIDGVLLVDKPVGMTSHDVITKIKRILNISKIGHAGTLDPMASGLLVVLLGEATKLSDYIVSDRKKYRGQVTLGLETSTLDSEGEVIATKPVESIAEEKVDEMLNSLLGELDLVPPMYSAIKVNGEKMYDLARQGITIDLEPRKTTLYSIKRLTGIMLKNECAKFRFECAVSKGTYIRSLCKEIGNRLGYPAYMSKLSRTEIGGFKLNRAYSLDDIEKGNYKVISMLDAVKSKVVIEANETICFRVRNGMKIYLNKCLHDVVFIKFKEKLIGVYELIDSENYIYKAKRVWK